MSNNKKVKIITAISQIVFIVLQRFSRKYPKNVERVWLCYECAKFNKKTKYNTDFKKNGLDIGSLVPLYKSADSLHWYKITAIYQMQGNDFAMWDNGKEYDLKYHHIEKIVQNVID